MTILEAFKDDNNYDIRLTHGCRWLYYDSAVNQYVVMEHKPYAKKNLCVFQGDSEELAVQFLLEE